jgi:predicted PurR-regulated permease PerM
MMSNLDWIQAVIFMMAIAVQSGMFYNKVTNLKEDLDDLAEDLNNYKISTNKEINVLKMNHQTIQLTIVNSPTKDDIKSLSSEVQSLKMTLVRLEVILEHLAQSQGLSLNEKHEKRHADN